MKKYSGLFLLCVSVCTNTMEKPSAYCDESAYLVRGVSKMETGKQDESYIELTNSTGVPFYARITVGGELKYKEETGRWLRTQPGEIQFKDRIDIGTAIEIVRRKYQPLTLRFCKDSGFTQSYRAEFLSSDQLAGLRTIMALLDAENYLVLRHMYDFKGACCSICLNHVQENDNVNVLSCGHFFHDDCVEEWLAASFTCPQCSQQPESIKIYHAVDCNDV